MPSYNKGNAFLAGDSAHCHPPAGGRGMNLGIEDAVILAALMSKDKLELYHDLRYPVGKTVIQNSTGLFKRFSLRGHAARLMITFLGILFYFLPFLYMKLINENYGLSTPKLYDILQ